VKRGWKKTSKSRLRQVVNRDQSRFFEAINSEASDLADDEVRPPGEGEADALQIASYSYG